MARQKTTPAPVYHAVTIASFFQTVAQSIVAVDGEGRVTFANTQAETMFGYGPKELLDRPFHLLIPHSADAPLTAVRRDGTAFPIHLNSSSLATPSGPWTLSFIADITDHQRLETLAQANAREVHALLGRLVTAQDEERRRVSCELHDQICQQLAALALDISALALDPTVSPEHQRKLNAIHGRIERVSEETRHIAYQIHPSIVDDLGLVASLQSVCREFSKRQRIPTRFRASALPDRLPREMESCLYRITQESLENIAKHARAKHAWVSLTCKKKTIFLSIADDGAGFNSERGDGLGLTAMKDRARLVNGRLSLLTLAGQGTRISFEVSLPEGTS